MSAFLLRVVTGLYVLVTLCLTATAQSFTAPDSHARIEAIARGTAYEGGNTQGGPGLRRDPALARNLRDNDLEMLDHIDDPETGMQALLLRDRQTGKDVIAFRGTWPNLREGAGDVAADADGSGDVGSVQYNANRSKIQSWARDHPDAVVTGHSLGAALAQRYMSEHPASFSEGVVFNAPAIAQRHAHRFARAENSAPVTIYVGRSSRRGGQNSVYDLVSELGGQSHLPATIVEVTDTSTARTSEEPGMLDLLGNSHTFTMLDGSENRILRTVSFDEFQQRRQQSWDDASTAIGGARIGVLLADAVQIGVREKTGLDLGALAQAAAEALAGMELPPGEVPGTAEAIAGLAHGFGNTGPLQPTPAMRLAAEQSDKSRSPDKPAAEDRAAVLQTELRTLLDRIDVKLRKVDGFMRRQADYCTSIETADVDADRQAVRAEVGKLIDPLLEQARRRNVDDVANFEIVSRLRPTILRASERATEESTKACAVSDADELVVEDIKSAALKSRNHAELASELFREAEIAAGRVSERTGAKNASLPHPKEVSTRVSAIAEKHTGNLVAMCRRAESDGVAHMAGGAEIFSIFPSIQLDLTRARRALDQPALPNKVGFTLEYAELVNRQSAIAGDMSSAPTCRKRHEALLALCQWSVADEYRDALGGYATAFFDVRAQRQKSGADLQRLVSGIRQSVADAREAAGAAAQCLKNAEESKPDLADDVMQLSDLRGVECSSDVLGKRVEELQSSRYDGVADIDRIRARLRAANSTVFNARLKLRYGREKLAKYRKFRKKFRLREARRHFSGALDSLKSLPSGLNCNRLQGQLRTALRDASELEKKSEKRRETFDQAKSRCQAKYGSQFLKVIRKSDRYRCRFCKKDYEPRSGRCIPTQAAANKWCTANNKGSGYVAFDRKADGTFSCRLSRSAANRWCNRNRDGRGWVAHAFDKEGSFKCRRPNTSKNRRSARADCRRQVKASGKVYAYTKFHKDGSYDCRWCPRGHYYKKGKCHARRGTRQQARQRRQQKSDALYRCWKCPGGICSYGSTGQQYYSSWAVPGGKCKRVR